jgi:hypothetical protein
MKSSSFLPAALLFLCAFQLKAQDTIPPEISLIGKDTVIRDVFTPYVDEGVKLSDNQYPDSVLSLKVEDSTNSNVVGTGFIRYTATDPEGNTSSRKRIVSYIDTIPPVIKLIGPEVLHVYRWHKYVDSGIVIKDNYDNVAEMKIDTISNVNTMLSGTFYSGFRVIDRSGNRSNEVTRIVIIEDGDYGMGDHPGPPPSPPPTPKPRPSPAELDSSLHVYVDSYGATLFATDIAFDQRPERICIFDLSGKQIRAVDIKNYKGNLLTIDLSGTSNGIYIFRFGNEQTSFSRKFFMR